MVGKCVLCLLVLLKCLQLAQFYIPPTDAPETPDHPLLFFSTPLEDSKGVYKDHSKAILSCNGGSNDKLSGQIKYRWFKNGREIINDPRYVNTIFGDLEIPTSDYKKDNALYQCMITDSTAEKWALLSNTAELYLAFAAGPYDKGDIDSYGEQGQPWKYIFPSSEYEHSKFPKPKYIWEFEQKRVQENERISISEDGNLYIAQVKQTDAGKYSFELEIDDKLKQKRETVNLKISKSTVRGDIYGVFMLAPKSQTISLKQYKEVTFECFVSGRPMPQITWRKEGRLLSKSQKFVMGAYNKRLTIKYLTVSDSATYECAITRAATKSVSRAVLTVVDPPHIKSLFPHNQIGHIGNFSLLTCHITTRSYDNFQVKWYRNGVKLSASSTITMDWQLFGINDRQYILNVSRLERVPDGGMYQCFATNKGGEAMAYTAIDVQTLKPQIIEGPGRVFAVRGRPIWIKCIAIGSPPLTFTWEKNAYPLTTYPPDNGKNGSLYIRNVQQSDVAQYTCIASNGPRRIDSHRSSGWLEIVDDIKVVNTSSVVYVPKGSFPNLYCGIVYDPKVNVSFKWYFKDVLVRNGRKQVKLDGRLVIQNAYEPDDGVYRCEARSPMGNFSTTVEVVVQAPPLKTTTPQVRDIKPDSVLLLWKAGYDGNSAIKHFIIGVRYENGTEVIVADRVTASGDIKKYVVPGLTPSTKYEFRLKAVNSVGMSPWCLYSQQIITREAAPVYKLKKVKGVAVDDDTIEISWEYPPTDTHYGILLGYNVAYKYAGVTSGQFTTKTVNASHVTTLEIDNLILNSPYEIKVQMYNEAGAGPFSEPIVVKTKEGFPSSAPRNFAVKSVMSRSIVLQWDAPPQVDWNGDLQSYIIRLWEFDKETVVYQRQAKHDPSAFVQVFNVTHLDTYTQYVFKVSAHNNVGGGPEAGPIQVSTSEDVPSAPYSLSIVEQYSDTISVSWKRPRQVNGRLIGYKVKYWKLGDIDNAKFDQVDDGEALQAGITSLETNTEYVIEVAAETKIGVSPSSRIRGKTLDAPVRPGTPTMLRFREVNATSLELNWKEGSKGRSPIIKYLVEGNNETGFVNDKTSTWFDALILAEPYKIFDTPPVIIRNLRPFTVYRFRVKAVNKIGSSYWSQVSPDQKTAEDSPSSPPLNIRVQTGQFSPGELWLEWKIPPKHTWNSYSIQYSAFLQEVANEDNFFNITGIIGQATRFRFPLKKFTDYKINMWTVNRFGTSPESPTIVGRTQEHVPSSPPENIRALGASTSSLRITWEPVEKGERNGRVIGYKMFHALVEFDAVHEFTEVDVGNDTSYLLKGLKGYTHYDIRLLAYTKVGDGERSNRLRPYARTLETKPGPPSNLRFPTISSSSVVVSWDVPASIGGNLTAYRVRYKLRDDAGAKFLTRPTLEYTIFKDDVYGLGTDKYYIFEVQAYTKAGWGKPATGEVYTSREGNKGVPYVPLILPISDQHISSRSVTIRWAVVTRRRYPIRYFTLEYRQEFGAWQPQPKPLTGSDRQVTVWGLTPGHVYQFRISSTIDAATSDYSKASPPVKTLKPSPMGSPKNVIIFSPNPRTLRITWEPPSLVDIQSTIRAYRVAYRRFVANPGEDYGTGYLHLTLPASDRAYDITGLEPYTLYDVKLTAIDHMGQELTSYSETRRTAPKIPPRPDMKEPGNIGPTSVTLYWNRPSNDDTIILGYKAVFETSSRRRRKRATNEFCDSPEPGAAYFSNTSSQGTISNLNMYTTYRIVLKSYNTAGDSPGSSPVTIKTKEGVPGPPATFGFDGVYGTEVHLYWIPPCEPNGRIQQYKLTVTQDSRGQIQQHNLDSDVTEYMVKGLALMTSYTFELAARTSRGLGLSKVLRARTGRAPVKPGPPNIIRLSVSYNQVTITWRDGPHGNTPITQYIFQARAVSERSPWKTQETFSASEVHKNRTERTKYATLKDLDTNTGYWFRIVVENSVDRSVPSPISKLIVTGNKAPDTSTRIYEKIWFIAVMAVIGFIIILLIIICIVCICLRKRRRRSKRILHPGFDLSIKRSDGQDLLSNSDDNQSNGGLKTRRGDGLLDDSDYEQDDNLDDDQGGEEDEASSLESKSDLEDDSEDDDISKKKEPMAEELPVKDKYSKPLRSFSFDNVHGSPPPAYATFASRANARSEPFLEPYNDFGDDDGVYKSQRPPTRRAVSAYNPDEYDSSDSSEIQRRKRGDPRSSSFRRALVTGGKPEPEPERPIDRPKPLPRKYRRSLENAVNESAKPPSYHDDDDDDDVDVRIRQPGHAMNPPEYRSDSGRDSSDELLNRPSSSRRKPSSSDRSESPAPAYQSSEGSTEYVDRGRGKPEAEISSYSSYV